MTEDTILKLKTHFYDPLCDALKAEKKLNNGETLFLKLMYANANNVGEWIEQASISDWIVDSTIVSELIKGECIRASKDASKLVITAKGIWVVESKLERVNLNDLIKLVDKKKFVKKWGKKLSEQDKVALLTLISLRCFYKKTPLNRKTGGESYENIIKVIEKCTEFLNCAISDFNYDLYGKAKREKIPDAIFARKRDLPQQTRGIYHYSDNKSWLSLYSEDNDSISIENIGYLFWRIFGEVSIKRRNEIISFCNDIVDEHKNYIYNSEEKDYFVFSNIKHRAAIKTSLLKIIEMKNLWIEKDKAI